MSDELLRQRFRYDADTGQVINRTSGISVHDKDRHGYVRVRLKMKGLKREYAAHRVGWFLHHGAWPSGNIDHVNGDRTDNRIANLRIACKVKNAANSGPYKNNKSGYRGVIQSRWGKFTAAIQAHGVERWLGSFETAEEAARAYDAAARAAHGEFARTNFPNPA